MGSNSWPFEAYDKKLETYRIFQNAEAHKYEKSLERIQYGEYVMKHSC